MSLCTYVFMYMCVRYIYILYIYIQNYRDYFTVSREFEFIIDFELERDTGDKCLRGMGHQR